MKEIWKIIENTDEQYSVSNLGNVKSNERTIFRSNGRPHYIRERVLKQGTDNNYKKVSLKINGKFNTKAVHRLVALSFIPNPDNKPQVNHIDGNPSNNLVTNLEWVTNSENQLHAYNTLDRKPQSGENNGMSKLTYDDVLYIREQALTRGRYYGRKELALKFNVSEGTIKEVVTNKIWKK